MQLRVSIGVLVLGFMMVWQAPAAVAQASVHGTWQTLPTTMTINPIHTALMANGKILVVSGSGNYPSETTFSAGVYDPATDTLTTQTVGWDMFCNGMVVLPDGRPFIMGGNLQYDPFHGWQRTAAYDPATGKFTDLEDMAHGRWYPTSTVLGDGRVMTFSGLDENGATDSQVEIYKVGVGWEAPHMAPWTPPLYPRMHVLPNGKVFYSGLTTQSRTFDPSTNTWSGVIATTNYGGSRTYGSSVLLPLTPANGYKPKVMIFGGGNPSTATTEIIDLSAASPAWVYGPSMAKPRIEMNATLLPNGKILTVGGSLNDEDVSNASLQADLYDSTTNTMGSAGSNAVPRLYHSVSLLLPDGTVWVAGGNPQRGSYETSMEIYSPPYLFKADGTAATRPAITSVTPGVLGYGAAFQVQTPDAANITSVVLMKDGAVTHAFDMDQRMVGLPFTAGSGVLNVTAPPNGNIAPPGYYMLFLLNTSGVPSVAKFVQLSTAAADAPPSGTITSPATDISLNSGQTVSFSGTGSSSAGTTITGYSWSFRGATPATSSQQSSGPITFTTIGKYTAVFTVTDSAGLTDPSPKTRTITVLPVLPAPELTSVTPNAGTQGLTSVNVTMVGTNFVSPPVCNFGLGVDVNTCTLISANKISANIDILANAATGTRDVTVTNPDGQIARLANGFTVNAGAAATAPTLTAVTPNAEYLGTANATIVLTGNHFQPSPKCDFDVDFGGTINTCTYDSPTQITVSLTIGTNAQLGGHNVTVTNADGQTATLINGFTVTQNLGNTVKLGAGFTAGAMVLVGNAALAGNVLQITDARLNEASAAWYATPVNVQNFATDFSFQVTPAGTTADGFTFTLQGNSTAALGQVGGQLGYGAISPGGPGGIPKSVAVKFDLYNNVSEGADSVGLYVNAADPTVPSVDMTGTGIDLHSGHIFAVHMTYDGTSLAMTITDTVSNASFSHSWTIDIPTTVGGSTAYAGFTGGTGGLTATQDVFSWTLGPLAPVVAIAPPSPLAFPDTATNMTSSPITLTITNGGNSDLHISGITTTGTNPGDFVVASNTCITAVVPTASCTVGVTFKPTGTGARLADLTIADDAAGSPQTVTLTGNGTAPPAPVVVLNPAGTVTFPTATQGTTSAPIPVSVTNTGNASLNITTVAISGANASDFVLASGNCINTTLAPSTSCSVGVTFTPSAAGTRQATLQISDNATGSPQSVGLNGNGVAPGAPAVRLIPPGPLTFPNTVQNTSSGAAIITVENSGTADLTITAIAISGANASDFAIAAGTTCGTSGSAATIAGGSSCAVAITFSPSAIGVRQGTLQITDNAAGSPQAVGLSGTGTTPPAPLVSISPAGVVTFPSTTQNTTSAASVLTLTNTGNAILTISALTITGGNASDFALAAGTTCAASGSGATVGGGSSCLIAITFTPSATGVRQTTLQIADNAAGSPQSVTISGTGTAAIPSNPAVTIAPPALSVAATEGTTGGMSNVTVTNSGNAPLHITGISYSGANVAEFVNQANPCAATLAPNASCSIAVSFSPLVASGTRSESISIADDAANSPQTISVTGTPSPAFVLSSPSAALAASVSAGQTATYNLQLTPGAAYSGSVSMSCTGAPAHAGCAVTPNPIVLTAGSAANFTVKITTTARSLVVPYSGRGPISVPMTIPGIAMYMLGLWLAAIAALYRRYRSVQFAWASRTRRMAYGGLAVLILAGCGLAGCATGNNAAPPPPGQTGTPQGTYTITLMPAASSMTGQPLQSTPIQLSLTVN